MENRFVELQNVSKEYGSSDNPVIAIDNIALTIPDGEFLVILGKSGSGKSTLLSLIGGLEQPTKGTIKLQGQDLSKMTEDELAIMRRTGIGVVFQHFYLMDTFTAIENIELPMLVAGMKRKNRRPWAKELLTLVGLDERGAFYPNELSGGERQRVGIARSFANKAKLIIADEPTGDLDSKKGNEIVDLLFEISQNGYNAEGVHWKPTIVMVTHDVGMLREGMRVVTLSDGKIISDEIFDGDYEKIDPQVILDENR